MGHTVENIAFFHKQLLRLLIKRGPLSVYEIIENLKFRSCARKLLPALHLLERIGYIRVVKEGKTAIDNVYGIDEDALRLLET